MCFDVIGIELKL